MSALKYRSDIDGLRALAVLSVVVYHVNSAALPGGFLGVDIFFVISGYLISLLVFRDQAKGEFSFADFYARRVRRLFPALAAVLLCTLVFGAFTLFSDEYRRLGLHVASAIAFLLNFQLMKEAGYFDVVSDSKPLLHLWSLSVEEQFYLVWPALVVLMGRMGPRIYWVMGLLAGGSLVFAVHLAGISPDTLYFHPLARFWELLAGAALAFWHHRSRVDALPGRLNHPWVRHLLSLVGLSAVIYALGGSHGKLSQPGVGTLFPMLGVVALIASGSASAGNRLLAIKPMVGVGLVSYPLYLWHWPVLSYLRIMESGAPSDVFLGIGIAAALLLAVLTYRYLEIPLRHARNVRRAVWVLGGSMFVLLSASLYVVTFEGLPNRRAVGHIEAAKAQMKREPATDSSCLRLFSQGEAPVYCRLHNSSDRMIAVIGDSHAHVLFPGVADQVAAGGYGTLLLANSGCPPLDRAVTGRTALERTQCTRSIDRIFDAIERDKRIVGVVMATRGPQYITGTGFGPAEANYNYPPISAKEAGEGSSDLTPYEVFRHGLQASIRRLNQRGLPVAYVLQVPELGVPARNCLRRPLTVSHRPPGCSVSRAVYQERMRSYRTLVSSLELDRELFVVIDPESVFCDDLACIGVRDDQLLYADDNHLSNLGAKRVAPLVSQGLFALRSFGARR